MAVFHTDGDVRVVRLASAKAREIAFVDPAISGLDRFLTALRPGVDAIVLSTRSAALGQIADALRGRGELEAIHIVAHGEPGHISFASGALSLATIGDPA